MKTCIMIVLLFGIVHVVNAEDTSQKDLYYTTQVCLVCASPVPLLYLEKLSNQRDVDAMVKALYMFLNSPDDNYRCVEAAWNLPVFFLYRESHGVVAIRQKGEAVPVFTMSNMLTKVPTFPKSDRKRPKTKPQKDILKVFPPTETYNF